MGIGLSRGLSYLIAPIAVCAGMICGGTVAAAAGECPGNPNALGVSRTIVVDPHQHTRIGLMSYAETLPLVDKEVVLTFDDGPLPPYTDKILAILAGECVKATYFIVGAMAKAYPDALRRVYDAGHTIGTHSMTHPIPFRTQGFDRTKAQIDEGIAATTAVLGENRHLAPFFRFPGFGKTEAAEEYLATQGIMIWGADVPADDWRKIGPSEVARRAVRRLEARGKGILLLHDIHERTVEALPAILAELKENGFRIVHVVPSGPDRPATVTAAADWRPQRHAKAAMASASALPVILISAVQNPDGEGFVKKTEAALCSLKSARDKMASNEPPIRAASRRHGRRAQVAHMPEPIPDKHAVQ